MTLASYDASSRPLPIPSTFKVPSSRSIVPPIAPVRTTSMTRSLVTDQDLASLSLMAHVSSGAGLPAGCFARELEARGRARATVTRQPCTIAGFYTYAVEEELL